MQRQSSSLVTPPRVPSSAGSHQPQTPPAGPVGLSRAAGLQIEGPVLSVFGRGTGLRAFDITDGRNIFSWSDDNVVVACACSPTVGFLALVCDTARRVVLIDTNTNERITDLYFDEDIIALRLNSKRLIVTCCNKTHVLDLNSMEVLPQIRTVNPANAEGIVALGPLTLTGECNVALPQSADLSEDARGDVMIIDTISCTKVTVIRAHQSKVAQVTFSSSGNSLATCSTRGNVIRVFTIGGQLLYSFKRGTAAATIFCVALDSMGSMCACTSSSGTLHVFRSSDVTRGDSASETRAFAKVALPVGVSLRSAITIAPDATSLSLATADSNGIQVTRFALSDTAKREHEFRIPL